MTRRDFSQDAAAAIVAWAGQGHFGWGEPLVVTALAEKLRLSPTPVREALARLSGEGLIDHHPGRGYFAPSPAADDLVDLLDLHRRLVHWALDLAGHDGRRASFGPIDASSCERVFIAMARASGRALIAQNHWRVTLQLRPMRAILQRMGYGEPPLSGRMIAALIACDLDEIRREVDVHHRDAMAYSEAVVSAMRMQEQSIVQI